MISLINIKTARSLSLLLCWALFLSVSLLHTWRIMPARSPFSGMQTENCIEILNEPSGQCWPQHQLTQLLIMALIRAADGESLCKPECKLPAETCRCTRIHAHTRWLLKYKKRLYKRGCVHFKNRSFLYPASLLINVDLDNLDLSDPAKVGWKHNWYQNSPKTFYLESLRQRVKGTCCPHPKTWSNGKRMSTTVACQLPKLREDLVFLWWRENDDFSAEKS